MSLTNPGWLTHGCIVIPSSMKEMSQNVFCLENIWHLDVCAQYFIAFPFSFSVVCGTAMQYDWKPSTEIFAMFLFLILRCRFSRTQYSVTKNVIFLAGWFTKQPMSDCYFFITPKWILCCQNMVTVSHLYIHVWSLYTQTVFNLGILFIRSRATILCVIHARGCC